MSLETAPEAVGSELPRVGPSTAEYSRIGAVVDAAEAMGIHLRPWQVYASDVMTSTDAEGNWLYREVAIIAARQNGKTLLLAPRVMAGLQRGERIVHTAQNRDIPRELLMLLDPLVPNDWKVRLANGQERITTPEGGSYKIVAPQRGARGLSADLLIIDELREFEDFDFIAAADPILTESPNPQTLYLSNAGKENSVVLNDLRNRSEQDENLAYMEWSAAPERAPDDQEGWLEANPSIGHGNNSLSRLQALYDKYREAGELAVFETEHLCRWVKSMSPRLVSPPSWLACRGKLEEPIRPAMGISVDPSGRRASAVMAWAQSDGTIGLQVTADVTGEPINLTALAVDLVEQAKAAGVQVVGFDPWTDQHLARHFPITEGINGQEYANASERFVSAVETQGIRWQYADAVSDDLPNTSRRITTGRAFMAEAAGTRSVTAALAAIRAVWLASNPRVQVPSIY
jgi:hypothetical protein